MPNYSNSIIYKLCCRNTDIKEIYIGSTTNFSRRKSEHKHTCNTETNKDYNIRIYQFIRSNGGWSNFDMVQVENYNAQDKRDLHSRERYWIEKMQASLNYSIPNTEHKESAKKYYENNKDKIEEVAKIYRENNKEKIKERKKNYYEKNKEKIKERTEAYRERNKEKIKERVKAYRERNKEKQKEIRNNYFERNKDKLREKINCGCGKIYMYYNRNSHFKSKKHKLYQETVIIADENERSE